MWWYLILFNRWQLIDINKNKQRKVRIEYMEIVNNVDMGETAVVIPVVAEVVEKVTKRHYTKRGTTQLGKRVVLLNGVPVGRGRPAKNGKGKRTVVYIPQGETYDVAKHGKGTEFRTARHSVFKRLKVANKVYDLKETSIEPVAV